jgi:hypothetical protein
MPGGTLKGLAVLAGGGLFLFGLVGLGKVAWQQLRDREQFTIAFADIECDPPPGQGRADFLDEVQYLAALPEKLRFLDEGLAERLAGAFARHPRVEKVTRVELTAPRRVRVRLVYRTPVLAVRWGGQTRVVDGMGVLLPRGTPARGLPLFPGRAPPPKTAEGQPWGDAAVEAAARRAGKDRIPSRGGAGRSRQGPTESR